VGKSQRQIHTLTPKRDRTAMQARFGEAIDMNRVLAVAACMRAIELDSMHLGPPHEGCAAGLEIRV